MQIYFNNFIVESYVQKFLHHICVDRINFTFIKYKGNTQAVTS
jgi:hypothetical protein